MKTQTKEHCEVDVKRGEARLEVLNSTLCTCSAFKS